MVMFVRTFLACVTFLMCLHTINYHVVIGQVEAVADRHDEGPMQPPKQEAGMLRLTETESEWRKLLENSASKGRSKHESFRRIYPLAALIDRDLPKGSESKFVDSVLAMPQPGASPEFIEAAKIAVLIVLVRRNDREVLTEMLSQCCPERVLLSPVEVWLATQGSQFPRAGGEIPFNDGIMVLCDAFFKAKEPAVRSVIAKAVARAFRPHVADTGDETRTVTVCREWYSKHRAELRVDLRYLAGVLPGGASGVPEVECGLFVFDSNASDTH